MLPAVRPIVLQGDGWNTAISSQPTATTLALGLESLSDLLTELPKPGLTGHNRATSALACSPLWMTPFNTLGGNVQTTNKVPKSQTKRTLKVGENSRIKQLYILSNPWSNPLKSGTPILQSTEPFSWLSMQSPRSMLFRNQVKRLAFCYHAYLQ